MVEFSTDEESECWSESLLEEHTDLACGIDLTTESCHAEVVLGSQGGECLALGWAHERCRLDHGLKVEGNVNLVTQLLEVGRLDVTGRLELGGSCPRGDKGYFWDAGDGSGVVSQRFRLCVGERSVLQQPRGDGDHGLVGAGVLDNSVESKGEAGGERVEERDHVNAGKVERGGVDRLEGERVVGTKVVVLELEHSLAGSGRELFVRCAFQTEDIGRLQIHYCQYSDSFLLTCPWTLVTSVADQVWLARMLTPPVEGSHSPWRKVELVAYSAPSE